MEGHLWWDRRTSPRASCFFEMPSRHPPDYEMPVRLSFETPVRLKIFEMPLRHPLFSTRYPGVSGLRRPGASRSLRCLWDAFETSMRRQRVSISRHPRGLQFWRYPWDFEMLVRLSFETPVRLKIFETPSRRPHISRFFSVWYKNAWEESRMNLNF